MRKTLILVWFCLSFTWANESLQWLQRGDSLFAKRAANSTGDRVDGTNIKYAIAAYKNAYLDSQTRLDAGIKIMQSLNYLGHYTKDSKELRLQTATEAKDLGIVLLDIYPDNHQVIFWWVVNLSAWAYESGVLAAIRAGAANDIKRLTEKMIAEGGDMEAKAYQVLGRMHQLLPKIPLVLSWPDKKLAQQYLEKACALDSLDPNNWLFLAEYYHKYGQTHQALEILRKLRLQTPRPEFLAEDRRSYHKVKEFYGDLLSKGYK